MVRRRSMNSISAEFSNGARVQWFYGQCQHTRSQSMADAKDIHLGFESRGILSVSIVVSTYCILCGRLESAPEYSVYIFYTHILYWTWMEP